MMTRVSQRISRLRRKAAVACVVALTAGLLPLAGSAAAGTSSAATELSIPAKYDQPIKWERAFSDEQLDRFGANFWPYNALELATMKVPVDWNNPGSGKDASIQLSRVLPKSGNVPT